MSRQNMRFGRVLLLLVAALSATGESSAFNRPTTVSRRSVFALPIIASASVPAISNALDMDAFMNQELAKDNTSKQLTDDEALCAYGQPSKERGEACTRAGKTTKLIKNGVDAYGKVNRGDFTRCKQFYDLDKNGKYVKKTECGLPPS